MTTLVEDLQALLEPLTAGGSWYGQNTAPQPVYPYIVFLRVVSVPNVALGGPSDLQNTRFQIDIFSRSGPELMALDAGLKTAMAAWGVANVPLSSYDLWEAEVSAYRMSKDYSVWARN